MKRLRIVLFLAFILSLCRAGAMMAENSSDPATQLRPEHLKKLEQTKMKVVTPSYLPKGFKVYDVKTENNGRFGYSYSITYHGPGGAEIKVNAASGGIGDVIPDGKYETIKFNNPVFGKGELYYNKAAGSSPDRITTQWLRSDTKTGMPVFLIYGSKISSGEAVRIAESLRYLEKQP